MDAKVKPEDKYVTVDGLKLRYIEEGSGPRGPFLHGASLGSSADVFLRNLAPFARARLPRDGGRSSRLRPERHPREAEPPRSSATRSRNSSTP